ncbi:hypothetical protein WA026_002340 [Henosepilachna vigintioctopunctata]|uniref:Uncharacterized protein n=1 Tax=Henosepilachna vigintioctopunctata TaxID=420089 RepID=A0AAW1U0W2_9CUCU
MKFIDLSGLFRSDTNGVKQKSQMSNAQSRPPALYAVEVESAGTDGTSRSPDSRVICHCDLAVTSENIDCRHVTGNGRNGESRITCWWLLLSYFLI